MRPSSSSLASLVGFVWALVVAAAAPCFAQGIEVSAGAPVRIEIAHVEATVEEGVAKIEVDETFRNTTDRQQEGVYRFKLPEDAVIGSFSMWMEGKEKQGRVLEAVQARRIYESIVRTRRDPGLLEQTGWRDFSVHVFPIPARDTVRIRMTYAHVVRDDLGLETLEIPLPANCGVVGDLRVHATVKAARGIASVDCPSHADAKLVAGADGVEATWTGDGIAPKGRFVLRSIPRRSGFDVSVLANHPAGADGGWFVARVVPRLDAPPQISRDVVFVIDRSGSMQGPKMDQARTALLAGLATLRAGDRFDVVSFSSDVVSLGGGHLLDATKENLEAARRAAIDITASGGTDIAGALAMALASRGEESKRFFAVVCLTDGDPTVGEMDPDRILAAWQAKAGSARLFAFGVGSDVKDFLLTKLATLGRGDARYVREGDNLEVPLAALFDRVKTPLLLDPQIDIEGVDVLDREPRRLPDLFQGRALVFSARYKGDGGHAVIHLRGRSGADDIKVDVPVDLPALTPARPYVAQIWAKARVERLLDDLRMQGGNREIREEIKRLGLTHQLVTPYTSFLVVEDSVRLPDPGEEARIPDAARDSTGVGVAPPRQDPVAQGGGSAPEIVDRAAVPKADGSVADGLVNPDEVIIPDAAPGRRGEITDNADPNKEPGEYNPDPDAPQDVASGATGGTSVGVGKTGHFGTGKPSAFVSRRAGAGGRGGGGLGQGGGGGTGGSTKATEGAVMWSLRWLKNHQAPDGRWASAGFDAQCKLNRCDGAGAADRDVSATGLSLLAFLGAGETHQSGTCRETVKNGLKYLRDIQDSEGCFGPRTSPRFLVEHAIGALAMTEAYGMTGSRVFKEPAQRAIAFALKTRTPFGGWNLPAPRDAELDVEATGWMVMVLKSGIMSGLDIDKAALVDAVTAIEKVTDQATGRVAVPQGAAISGDTATAIGVLVRIFRGRTPKDDEQILKGATAVAAKLPKWDASAGALDVTYWYFASLAMFQVGGEHWKRWNDAMKPAIIDHQRNEADRDERGSWDPVGAEGGGRIAATAFDGLCMEVYYRYGRVLGVREESRKPAPADPVPTPEAPTDGK